MKDVVSQELGLWQTYVAPWRPLRTSHPDQELKLVSGYEFCDHYEVWRVNFTLVKILTAALGAADKRCKGPMDSGTWFHWGDGWGPDEAELNPGPKKWRLLGDVAADPEQVFKWGCQVHPPCLSVHLLALYQSHKFIVNTVSFIDGGGCPESVRKKNVKEGQDEAGARDDEQED